MNPKLFAELQHCRGPLGEALVAINRDCLSSAFRDAPQRQERAEALLLLIRDRASAIDLLETMGKTTWPTSYGQSPYDEILTVIRCAVAGVALTSGSTADQRALHGIYLDAFALPSARLRWQLDDEGRRRRYPRLLRAMQHGALLTPGEADSVLRVLLRTNPIGRSHSPASCEASQHFGGNLKVVRAARLWRQRFASTVRMPLAA
jgi:hypothetical protein